jgi:hypothetical protein
MPSADRALHCHAKSNCVWGLGSLPCLWRMKWLGFPQSEA